MTDEIRAALDPVADAFEALGVSYRVGGSVASSALGVARTTLDVDLVADLRAAHVAPFVERLQAALDRAHLAHWANEIGVTDLLERALAEAGLD